MLKKFKSQFVKFVQRYLFQFLSESNTEFIHNLLFHSCVEMKYDIMHGKYFLFHVILMKVIKSMDQNSNSVLNRSSCYTAGFIYIIDVNLITFCYDVEHLDHP